MILLPKNKNDPDLLPDVYQTGAGDNDHGPLFIKYNMMKKCKTAKI